MWPFKKAVTTESLIDEAKALPSRRGFFKNVGVAALTPVVAKAMPSQPQVIIREVPAPPPKLVEVTKPAIQRYVIAEAFTAAAPIGCYSCSAFVSTELWQDQGK